MPALRWIGVIAVILGIALLIIPIPHAERHGVKIGDVSLGVTSQHDDKVPTAICVTMIIAGLAVAATAGSSHSS